MIIWRWEPLRPASGLAKTNWPLPSQWARYVTTYEIEDEYVAVTSSPSVPVE